MESRPCTCTVERYAQTVSRTLKGGRNKQWYGSKSMQQVVIKQPGEIILIIPSHLLGSLRYAYVYIAARRLDYCAQEVVLSQEWLSAVYITL